MAPRRQIPYVADYSLYRQQYGGAIPVFKGTHFQQGYGLGSLFGSLARGVLPVLKTAGKTFLKSGAQVIGDVISGDRDFTEAVRERGMDGLRTVGRNVTNDVLSRLDDRQPARSPAQRRIRKRRLHPTTRKGDIFDYDSKKRRRQQTRKMSLGSER